jgi:hypothetical protein
VKPPRRLAASLQTPAMTTTLPLDSNGVENHQRKNGQLGDPCLVAPSARRLRAGSRRSRFSSSVAAEVARLGRLELLVRWIVVQAAGLERPVHAVLALGASHFPPPPMTDGPEGPSVILVLRVSAVS